MNTEATKFCDDAAVCFETADNTLVTASYDDQGALRIERLTTASPLHEQIVAWRASLGRKTTAHTVFRYVPDLFMEQTRIASLPAEILRYDDEEITEWLVGAAAAETTGTDGKQIFESSLTDSAYDYTRLPSGLIALTEIPREAVEKTRIRVLAAATPTSVEEIAFAAQNGTTSKLPEFTQAVETRLRAVARFLIERDRPFFDELAADETIGFFCFTPQGTGFALWSPANSFYVELGDFFHFQNEEQHISGGMDKATYLGHLYGESVYNFLNDQFYRRIVPDDQSLAPINLKRVYWTAATDFAGPLEFIISEFSEQTEFPFVATSIPIEEMICGGLLLGAFEETTELVPAVNLANDIPLQHRRFNDAAEGLQVKRLRAGRRTALLYVLLPTICALGFIIGLLLNSNRISAALENRQSAAAAEKARLAPLLSERAEYEKTLAWYEDILRQIIGLRRKQSAALGFAARLDPLFPATDAFYISDLKLLPGGNFEIKGLARDQFVVSEFVRQLEFSEASGGARYFSNLTLEFKQGSAGKQSSLAGSSGGNPAPGVSGFAVKGNFAPAQAIIVSDAKPPLPLPVVLKNSAAPAQNNPNDPPSAPASPPADKTGAN